MIILLVGISGGYTILKLNDLNRLIDSMIRQDSRIIKLTEDALDDLFNLTAAEDKYLISKHPDYNRQFRQIRGEFSAGVDELDRIADTRIQKVLLANLKKSKGRYDALIAEREPSRGGQKVRGRNHKSYVMAREPITRGIERALRDLMRVSTEDRNAKLKRSNDMSARVTNIIIVSELIAIILVILITFINARKINTPIKLLGEKTKAVAAGQFGDPLQISSPPEIRELADSFNRMCERLQELDQMKIDYISHLSHELRTPLTVIKEASSMLREGVFAQAPEKQEELYEVIKAECERLISSVNRILDLSRMEGGDMPFTFQDAELAPIIEKNVLKLSPLTRKKGISIDLDLPPDIPPVWMDGDRIEEVFENLLGNALKYTPEGGKITVCLRNNSRDQTVEVSVSDNGRGIPEDGLAKVFEKFKRVDDRRGAVRGTGLGLAIVKHVINAHGGRIWVKSKVGEGSTFTFSLPASSPSRF